MEWFDIKPLEMGDEWGMKGIYLWFSINITYGYIILSLYKWWSNGHTMGMIMKFESSLNVFNIYIDPRD